MGNAGWRGPEGRAQRPGESLQDRALQKTPENKEIMVGQQHRVTSLSVNRAVRDRKPAEGQLLDSSGVQLLLFFLL